MRQLYLLVALSKITYGIDIWYMPPTKPAGYTRNTGSAGVLHKLQKAQHLATLANTGTLRTSPNDYVDVHARVLPIEPALLKACHNALVRSLTLPNTNPIHRIVRKAKRHPPLKHCGPFDNLLKLFTLRNTNLETIHLVITLTRTSAQIATKIDNSREDSINSKSNDDTDFKIFSDGSGQDDGVGSAAILYEKGRIRSIKSLQVYLGTPDKHNSYEAEAVGAILALWIIQNTPETTGRRVSLYIDNQALITAIKSPKLTPGQHLLNNLRLALNGTGCRLLIKWILGHSKVRGNEEVDRLAKEAAAERSSPMVNLPHVLRTPLPVSASALKQDFNSSLKEQWKAVWNTSLRRPRIAQFKEDFPFSAFLKRLSLLTRKQSSLILQIRSSHFPLNPYLHKINKIDSNTCQACYNEEDDFSPIESINHFIFDCTAHNAAREELIDQIGMIHFNLLDIMADTDRMKALTTFINRSGRFKD
jgi:ribonuclease HI